MIRATRRLLVRTAAAAVDIAFTQATQAMSRSRRAGSPDQMGHEERLGRLEAIARLYPAEAPGYFRPAREVRPTRTPLDPEGAVVDLVWPSDYEPWLPAMAEKWDPAHENRYVAARLVSRGRRHAPRPAIVLIHGYLGGNFALERQFFPVDWLLAQGLDVALFTLPFHGRRAEAGRRVPRFPGSDPRITLEGLRQAEADLLDLVAYLLSSGHPTVGLMGMSLGGYTTALAATLEPRLAYAVPLIPLASFADWALEHGRLSPGLGIAEREHAALEAVYRVISPLHRAPALPGSRMLVLAAESDRITPKRHAERIAEHFGAPLKTFPGGHMLQVGRDRRLKHLASLLRDLGVLPRG